MSINEEDYMELVRAFLSGALDLDIFPEKDRELLDVLMAAERQCDELYEQAYQAKCRLFERLHSDEDPDVNCIYENIADAALQYAKTAFECGMIFARIHPEEAAGG